MTNHSPAEMIDLVTRLSHGEGSDDEASRWLGLLEASVPYPSLSDLIFYPEQEKSPEEIVDAALGYQLPALPPPR